SSSLIVFSGPRPTVAPDRVTSNVGAGSRSVSSRNTSPAPAGAGASPSATSALGPGGGDSASSSVAGGSAAISIGTGAVGSAAAGETTSAGDGGSSPGSGPGDASMRRLRLAKSFSTLLTRPPPRCQRCEDQGGYSPTEYSSAHDEIPDLGCGGDRRHDRRAPRPRGA